MCGKMATFAAQTKTSRENMKDFKIRHRQDKKTMEAVHDTCKKRIERNKYVSEAARRDDLRMVSEWEEYLRLCAWVEAHCADFTEVDEKRKEMAVMLPFADKDTKECRPVEAKIKVLRCEENYTDRRLNVGADYDWICCSKDFMGKRLDWDHALLNDILAHQDDIEGWCRDFARTITFKRYVGDWSYVRH